MLLFAFLLSLAAIGRAALAPGCSAFALARGESDWEFSATCAGTKATFPVSACVGNINGALTCGQYFMGLSCTGCTLAGSQLSCSCARSDQTAQQSTLELDGCLGAAQDGKLVCSNA